MFQYFIQTATSSYSSPIVRAYVYLRFKIINRSILDVILNYVSPTGRIVVLGCGFGLFDLLIGLRFPKKRIQGYDISEGRINTASQCARKLGLKRNSFGVKDLCDTPLNIGPCDEILLLDIIHHIPPDAQLRVIADSYDALNPDGCLIIKDVHRANRLKLLFTWLLDYVMTKGEKVWYQSREYMTKTLQETGFSVIYVYLDDVLPYPHILYVCVKDSNNDAPQ